MQIIRSLYIAARFYLALFSIAVLFTIGFFVDVVIAIAEIASIGVVVICLVDLLLLYSKRSGIEATRIAPNRLSNGDENTIKLLVKSNYGISTSVEIIDEIPIQFQIRNFSIHQKFTQFSEHQFSYKLTPVNRGDFDFGSINIFVNTNLSLFKRRFTVAAHQTVPVYPSYIQMRKFEMYAISNRLTDLGVKKVRRLGHTMEFDQIREYVRGDDIRSINWKATARSNHLMINQYQDERSQQIINMVDLGRVMKMPFDGLQLLEYAINTSLVLSNIAVLKEDKAGLISFSNDKLTVVPPDKKRTHVRKIQQALYNIETNFMESDYDKLLVGLKSHIKQRSLVLLYTNFETLSSMERQLPYLRKIAKDHLLVTIFFENTELTSLTQQDSENVSDIYLKTIAEKFSFEKKQIIKSLNSYGIHSIYTPPKELSINAINKYLELKARALI
ncbi:MAG: DUF58 domain-containing protein [Balneolaceae bacterium]|nr:DUF58 domain-containing protein [Balneolaceae bacterium]